MHRLPRVTLALALSGCAMETGASHAALASDDALLAFVNDQEQTDLERLDVECGIRSDSARQIIRHRDGNDRAIGTEDDDLFDTVEELDGVAMVGPWTLDRLRECAEEFGYETSSWRTTLETSEQALSSAAIAALPDGRAALLYRGVLFDPSGNQVVSQFREFDGASWSSPVRLDEGLPSYASSYGTEIEMIFDHHLVALPDGRLVAGLTARYSSSYQNAEGALYAIFLRVRDESGWGAWQRVTPVGNVFDAAITADASGNVWVAWTSAYNLAAGTVYLALFDPTSGVVSEPEIVSATPAFSTFQKVDLAADGDTVWITYWSESGLDARARSADGSWSAPLRVSAWASHASAVSDGVLWVAASIGEGRLAVFRHDGAAMVQDAVLFTNQMREDAYEQEATTYTSPAITAAPGGRIVVGAGRAYHFERWVDPISDADRTDTVVRERTGGVWGPEEVAYGGKGWDNPIGGLTTSGDTVWAAGGTWNGLFAARHTLAP